MIAGTALVTGPTAGIGRAFAEALGSRGHDLVLVARDAQRLDELAEHLRAKHGVEVEVIVADLADRSATARVEARLAEPERPVSILVNNAGFGHKQPFTENSVEDEQEMLDVLVTAVMRLSHAAIGPMLERGEGAIVNVSSVAAFLPRGTYSAAKRYVVSFSEWLDVTYRDRGVRCLAVCPGFVKTEFHERMGVGRGSAPSWLWLDADRLVEEALDDLARGKTISVPSKRYKAITALVRYGPTGFLGRFQRLGRK
ncbi:MAG TPA: SDR family oxidoreductase [Nocardioidaceae bacterium]|nr:SDR family oxidoreductase [Nocardioidaceae bacterium]